MSLQKMVDTYTSSMVRKNEPPTAQALAVGAVATCVAVERMLSNVYRQGDNGEDFWQSAAL